MPPIVIRRYRLHRTLCPHNFHVQNENILEKGKVLIIDGRTNFMKYSDNLVQKLNHILALYKDFRVKLAAKYISPLKNTSYGYFKTSSSSIPLVTRPFQISMSWPNFPFMSSPPPDPHTSDIVLALKSVRTLKYLSGSLKYILIWSNCVPDWTWMLWIPIP